MSCTSWAAFEPSSGPANSAAVALRRARATAHAVLLWVVLGAQVAAFSNTDAATLPVWQPAYRLGATAHASHDQVCGQRVQASFKLGAFIALM